MTKKVFTTQRSKFHHYTANVILIFFLFTILSPDLPFLSSKAEAAEADTIYETSYSYYNNDSIQTRTTPNGDIIYYDAPDPLNRPTRINYPDGTFVSYKFDPNSNRTEMTDSQGTTYYTYDKFNRLRIVDYPNISPIYYDYDKANNLRYITYPTGEIVEYIYDNDNRLWQVIDSTGTTTYEYNNLTNNLIKTTLPNTATISYTYDLAKRITDVVNKKANGTLISSYHYDFDANNNRTKVTETTSSGTKTVDYTYDRLNRLTSATYSDGTYEMYTYDSTGNRLTKTTQSGTANYEYDGDNRLITAGGTNYYYDDSGNLVTKITPSKTVIYTYDYENRLTQYDDGTNFVEFEYDGDGNRISKTVNGVKTRYVNDVLSPVTQVLLETTDQYTVKNRYAYGYSRINQINQGVKSFYLYDNPGRSVTALLNNSQQVQNTYQYDSFGNIKTASETVGNNLKYVGEQFDIETGLIYLRNRYYDPDMGRFISKDPFPGFVRAPQTKNPYPYVGNNPLNLIDPTGNIPPLVALAAGTFLGGGLAGVGGQAANDLIAGEFSGWESYAGAFTGGGTSALTFLASKSPWASGLTGGAVGNLTKQGLENLTGKSNNFSTEEFIFETGGSAVLGRTLSGVSQLGINKGSNSYEAVTKQMFTKTMDGQISNISTSTAGKIFTTGLVNELPSSMVGGEFEGFYSLGQDIYSDYGGVSLSKTATLMGNINDIAGAGYDENTEQLVLYGKQDASLPPMNLDDLAVAVRSIYGYGGKTPKDPGVSIGTEPSDIAGQMKVRYDGQTYNTKFGSTMFESDRLLKTLTLGKDNITGATVSSSVPGFMNMMDRYQQDYQQTGTRSFPQGSFYTRMWFVPKEIKLGWSNDKSSMVFKTASMELLTESKFNNNVVTDFVAEAFADHFTQNYDNFANERPILKDLKRLGKITAVVKWIKDNDIPFDHSFFKNYTPSSYSTPQYTPQIKVEKKWKEGTTNVTLTMTGGVQYFLDASNFIPTDNDPVAGQTKNTAVNSRPNEASFNWGYSSQGQGYQAVAHTVTRSRKDGSVRRTETDMVFPVTGDYPLELVRYYNSFNDKASGFGYGWNLTPYKLRFPADKRRFSANGQYFNAYYQIFVAENRSENIYTLVGLDGNQLPVYLREGGQYYLKENNDGTFTLFRYNKGTVSFDPQGKLKTITDKNGIYISYNYSGSKLISILHQGGREIKLNYNDQNRISSATGPGSKKITYTYNTDNNLETVKNELKEVTKYTYDADNHLKKVIDPRGNTIFRANFDDYNRAGSQTFGSSSNYNSSFDIIGRTSTVTDPNNVQFTQSFDEDYRMTNRTDSKGRQVDITYDPNKFGPETIVDINRNDSVYRYDGAGNVIYAKDANDGERRFLYDYYNNLIIERDAMGYDTLYVYDASSRLTEIHQNVYCDTDINGILTGVCWEYPNNLIVTKFTYDSATGDLLSITDPEGRYRNFTYDENGMLKTITYPSGYQITYDYDSRSRLIRVSNQGGEYISYDEYDGADRIKSVTTSAGTVRYTYDSNGNADLVYDAKNDLTDYDYDANNNLVQVTDAEAGLTSYEYNPANNLLTRIILPNNSIKEIQYDDLNRPVTQTETYLIVLTECVDCPRSFVNYYPRAIGVDSLNRPHIAYGGDHLYYAYYDGTQWNYEIADNSPGVGQYASIAIDSDNRAHVSYYDVTNGNLKYATNASGNWNTTIVDNTNNVGAYSSIAVDINKKAHISYYDSTNKNLMYATNASGVWEITPIATSGTQGQYSSIYVDNGNNVHISYYDSTNANLQYAACSANCSIATSWSITKVDGGGTVGQYSSIAVGSDYKIHISYYDATNTNLKYATCSTNCSIAANWSKTTADSSGAIGQYSSIAVNGNNVHISYYDAGSNYNLKYATCSSNCSISTSWTKMTVDSVGTVGQYSSIAVDSGNNVHVSYYDGTNKYLKYATKASNASVFSSPSMIDSGREADEGQYSDIALDPYNKAYISYYDATNKDLKIATNTTGTWVFSTIDNSSNDVGKYSSIAISGGKIYISYYDTTAGNLRYASCSSNCDIVTNWTKTTVDSSGTVGQYSSITVGSDNKIHISYYDSTNTNLKYATCSANCDIATNWTKTTVDSSGTVGQYSSITVGSDNKIHISYYDSTNTNLKYATCSANCNIATNWSKTTADSSGAIGQYSSIAVDPGNNVHISYYDAAPNFNLMYVKKNVSGNWDLPVPVDSTGDTGKYSSIAIDSGDRVHISYYDSTNMNLKYASNSEGNWVTAPVDIAGNVGAFNSIAVDRNDRFHISYQDSTNTDLRYATNLVNTQPSADPGDPYTSVEGQEIILGGSGSSDPEGAIVKYEWDVDNDGNYEYSSSSPTQGHIYTQQGTYTIRLRVTDNFGATGEATTTIVVSDSTPVVSYTATIASGGGDAQLTEGFTSTALSGGTSLTIDFTDTSYVHDGIASIIWDFGDGSPLAYGSTVSHTYLQSGTYIVALVITDTDGSIDAETMVLTVGDMVADFIADPASGDTPLLVTFTDNTTGYYEPFRYEWDLDNNGVVDSTIQNPIAIYTGPGTYSVKLTVTDSNGNLNILTKTNYITVTSPGDTLTIYKTGNGSGIVTSTPAGIDCGSDCAETYTNITTVTLSAVPDSGSTFTGWTGGGCLGTSNCTVTMYEDLNVAAIFDSCPNLPVRIMRGTTIISSYTSLQAAYNNTIAGDVIQSQAVLLTESFNADDINNTSITIEGGYDCDYTDVVGKTVLKGQTTISKGTNRVKNVGIKK